MDKGNFLDDWASPNDWWFWLLLPLSGPLWLLGTLIDWLF